MPAKSKLRLVPPAIENRAVARCRPKNAELRGREHLTPAKVERVIIEVAKNNHRDATLILVAYRHGLRAAEVCRQEC
jgi:integrase